MFKFGYRFHRGGLQESLETIVYINEIDFHSMAKNYRFYAIDERCHQILFILDDMEYNFDKPTWLFIQYE